MHRRTPATDGEPARERADLAIIVPMYREAKRIAPTIRDLVATLPAVASSWEVLLVDDGSPDDTIRVAEATIHELDPLGELPIRILKHPQNRGKGGAVRTGLAAANADWCLVMDADNACRVSEVGVLLDTVRAPGGSTLGLIAGSRRVRGSTVTAVIHRRLAGWIFRAVLHMLGLAVISDTQCGFKLYRADLASHTARLSRLDGYAFDLEHLLLAKRSGLKIAEVGVRWEHQDGGQVNAISDGIKMAWAAAMLRARWLLNPPAMPRLVATPPAKPVFLAPVMIEPKPVATLAPEVSPLPAAS
jgi:dolichyl-phosphate beta-glucosyltransferase